MSPQEAVAALTALKDTLTKIGTETDTLLTKISDLNAVIAANPVPQAVVDAIAAVTAQAKVVDDKVPDA